MRFDLHPFKDIEAARSWARSEIDAGASAARGRYITITAGQDSAYQANYADALAFRRAGYPEIDAEQYPWIKNEADATGAHIRNTADGILAAGAPWNVVIGPRIEALRIGGKSSLDSMDSISAVVCHTRNVCQSLEIA